MSVTEQIREFLAGELASAGTDIDLTLDTRLIEGGILDSVTLMALVAFVERTFGVEVPPESIVPEHFDTLKDVAALVERLGPAHG